MFIKSVNSIVKAFSKANKELEELERIHTKRIELHNAVIEVSKQESSKSAAEIAYSVSVRAKLQDLISN